MHAIRRVLAGLLAAAAGTVLVPQPAAATPDAALARFHQQRLDWHGCQRGPAEAEGQALDEAGAQCAEVTVPLDYHRPDGRTITVAITRLPATDPDHRIGPLVVNLGGPGLPVLGVMPLARAAMGQAGARFDLIGMDVRFTGRSSPIDCGWPQNWMSRSAGVGLESFSRMVALSRDLAARCARRHGDVLPYASTATAARDLDVIRAALGAPTLSYLGYSQGSYLGAVYTQLFPQRAGRMVLDSAIDPDSPGVAILRRNAPEREAALREWAGLAAAHDDVLGLGATTDAVLATVHRVYQAAARQPLPVGAYQVDDTMITALLLDPLSDDSDDSNLRLAERIQVLVRAVDTGAAEPTPDLATALAGLLTGANSAQLSGQTAILCADGDVPADPSWYWRDIDANRSSAPLFGPQGRTITPCAFWTDQARQAPVRVRNGVPALIVQAAGDVNSTLSMGRAMHRAMSGSRLITLDGARTHGVYLFRGASCVDHAVGAYLETGALPATDRTCTDG
jgi:pimeloyl-ACP methyl ester carboxylesterase